MPILTFPGAESGRYNLGAQHVPVEVVAAGAPADYATIQVFSSAGAYVIFDTALPDGQHEGQMLLKNHDILEIHGATVSAKGLYIIPLSDGASIGVILKNGGGTVI
jgi:hypothetical protein